MGGVIQHDNDYFYDRPLSFLGRFCVVAEGLGHGQDRHQGPEVDAGYGNHPCRKLDGDCIEFTREGNSLDRSTVKTQKDAFRHVEAELYAYPYRKKEITRLREEILAPYDDKPDDPTVVKGKNSVRQPGDPTGNMAISLAGHAKLLHLERVSDAI